LCTYSHEELDKAWFEGWSARVQAAIGVVVASYPSSARATSMINDPTPQCAEHAGTECAAEAGEVYCRMPILARMLHALALSSASLARPMRGSDGRNWSPVTTEIALTLATIAGLDAPMPPELVEEMGPADSPTHQHFEIALALAERFREPALKVENAEDMLGALAIDTAATAFISFTLGHALEYASRACALVEPSPAESEGTFVRLVEFDATDVCDREIVEQAEINAERCALRSVATMDGLSLASARDQIRKLASNLAAPERVDTVSNGFARMAARLGHMSAIDAVASHLQVGYKMPTPLAKDGAGFSFQIPANVPARLYRALRLYLFAAALRPERTRSAGGVKLCDTTAERFTVDMESVMNACQTAGPDAAAAKVLTAMFGDRLPRAVSRGWASGSLWYRAGNPSFSPERFLCEDDE
jgi:hypothetical protein